MHDRALYSELAKYYDKIYWNKNYEGETDFLAKLFRRSGVTGRRLLEVGCGTGSHTKALVERGFDVTAVDLSEDVLRVAKRKVKSGAVFLQGDMRRLDDAVHGQFDEVVCLFSTISYNLTRKDLERTIRGFYDHVKTDGVVVFDTHFTKKGFLDGYRGEDIFDDGKVIGARLSTSIRKGDVGEISFTYLIKDGRKVITLRDDVHRLGLFAPDDFLAIMREVGFRTVAVYSDWTFSTGANTSPFKDSVFVGRKLA